LAAVYISVLGSDEERTATLTALRSATGFIRHHLRPRLRLRQLPDLEFRDDRSMEHAEQIDRTLRSLARPPGLPRGEESARTGVEQPDMLAARRLDAVTAPDGGK
jgi:ribosome-binding factor A